MDCSSLAFLSASQSSGPAIRSSLVIICAARSGFSCSEQNGSRSLSKVAGSIARFAQLDARYFCVTALWHNAQLIRLERGQPDRAIRLMAAEAPRGAEVDVRTYMLSAPIIVAARQADYPISVAKGCAPAEFMIVARGAHSTPTAMRCGQSMRAVGWSEATVLTGDSWVLYRAQSLQSQRSADSGRAPAAGNRRISGRAGVAQG